MTRRESPRQSRKASRRHEAFYLPPLPSPKRLQTPLRTAAPAPMPRQATGAWTRREGRIRQGHRQEEPRWNLRWRSLRSVAATGMQNATGRQRSSGASRRIRDSAPASAERRGRAPTPAIASVTHNSHRSRRSRSRMNVGGATEHGRGSGWAEDWRGRVARRGEESDGAAHRTRLTLAPVAAATLVDSRRRACRARCFRSVAVGLMQRAILAVHFLLRLAVLLLTVVGLILLVVLLV